MAGLLTRSPAGRPASRDQGCGPNAGQGQGRAANHSGATPCRGAAPPRWASARAREPGGSRVLGRPGLCWDQGQRGGRPFPTLAAAGARPGSLRHVHKLPRAWRGPAWHHAVCYRTRRLHGVQRQCAALWAGHRCCQRLSGYLALQPGQPGLLPSPCLLVCAWRSARPWLARGLSTPTLLGRWWWGCRRRRRGGLTPDSPVVACGGGSRLRLRPRTPGVPGTAPGGPRNTTAEAALPGIGPVAASPA